MNTDTVPIRQAPIFGMTHVNLSGIITQHNLGRVKRPDTFQIRYVIQKVAEAFGLPPELLMSRRRPEWIVWPRQVAMALIYEHGDVSLQTIGDSFGGRDHGTVINAVRRVKARTQTEPRTRELVEKIKAHLRG